MRTDGDYDSRLLSKVSISGRVSINDHRLSLATTPRHREGARGSSGITDRLAQRSPRGAALEGRPHIPDDHIRESIERPSLKLHRERGQSDVTIFSPRASCIGHHRSVTATLSLQLVEVCNDLIHRCARSNTAELRRLATAAERLGCASTTANLGARAVHQASGSSAANLKPTLRAATGKTRRSLTICGIRSNENAGSSSTCRRLKKKKSTQLIL